MNNRERRLYQLALSTGNRRFGSPCAHPRVRNGRCQHCQRKVK